ncbi:hypothetical protein GYMLUDRAFT_592273 [Collybiopsis luxurians FD-317 M1]|uniref:Uncharacterized protein n=1 Tax=Collybiopsis luxurians FD-317 M1 TaxID=944289 RepID=A0A0D0BZB1_9AGAR|nr:hypothetical protein GYMLUDRAFT_592273 [Collybiopsis luxurians FD-317 M1]
MHALRVIKRILGLLNVLYCNYLRLEVLFKLCLSLALSRGVSSSSSSSSMKATNRSTSNLKSDGSNEHIHRFEPSIEISAQSELSSMNFGMKDCRRCVSNRCQYRQDFLLQFPYLLFDFFSLFIEKFARHTGFMFLQVNNIFALIYESGQRFAISQPGCSNCFRPFWFIQRTRKKYCSTVLSRPAVNTRCVHCGPRVLTI